MNVCAGLGRVLGNSGGRCGKICCIGAQKDGERAATKDSGEFKNLFEQTDVGGSEPGQDK